jgi:RNA polymerase sigma factor (sigma-70 family)
VATQQGEFGRRSNRRSRAGKLIWKAVDNLSSRQRSVFLLRYVEELKLSEIAQTVGLQEGAVKCHLSRAVKKVRAALKEE